MGRREQAGLRGISKCMPSRCTRCDSGGRRCARSVPIATNSSTLQGLSSTICQATRARNGTSRRHPAVVAAMRSRLGAFDSAVRPRAPLSRADRGVLTGSAPSATSARQWAHPGPAGSIKSIRRTVLASSTGSPRSSGRTPNAPRDVPLVGRDVLLEVAFRDVRIDAAQRLWNRR